MCIIWVIWFDYKGKWLFRLLSIFQVLFFVLLAKQFCASLRSQTLQQVGQYFDIRELKFLRTKDLLSPIQELLCPSWTVQLMYATPDAMLNNMKEAGLWHSMLWSSWCWRYLVGQDLWQRPIDLSVCSPWQKLIPTSYSLGVMVALSSLNS